MVKFSNLIGFLGDFLILLPFFLLLCKKMKATTIAYSLLNLIGILMLLFSLYFSFNLSAAIIQISWVFISLYGLIRAIKENAKTHS
ncbi:MAG TPA: hypothetical protein DIC51_02870 [Coxiellaceae bacterium]|nr:hypothetical protein [Coxiellaceae bacterium]